jgi:hypothetical protein
MQFPKEFTMIDQFITEFEKFTTHESEIIENLTDETKVALFGIYCQTMAARAKQTQLIQPTKSEKPTRRSTHSQPQIKNPNRPASIKQLKCIAGMIEKGQLDEDIGTDDLTMGEASTLIDEGIRNNRKPRRAPEPAPESLEAEDEEPEGAFQGAYNNQTGSLASQNSLWG